MTYCMYEDVCGRRIALLASEFISYSPNGADYIGKAALEEEEFPSTYVISLYCVIWSIVVAD